MNYTPLQVISSYSLLQSNISIKDLVLEAKSRGYDSLTLTDRNVMYGAIEFYDECLKNDIKPIVGLTIELSGTEILDQSFELVLLAKNFNGYKNLMKISTLKMTEKRDNVGHELTLSDITPYLNHLFVIIPKNSEVFSLLMRGQNDLAINYVKSIQNNVDEKSLYFGVDINTSDNLIQIINNLSKKYGTSMVALSTVKYLNANDYFAVSILNYIANGQKITDPVENSHILGSEWLRGCKEMCKFFTDKKLTTALTSNHYISSHCNLKIMKQKPQLPNFKNDFNLSSFDFLKKLCKQGLKERLSNNEIIKANINKYVDRMKKELAVINRMGFNDYFLIVWDVINYSHHHNIMTGPGRGSAAGSLVAYVLKITDVDPIKYGLLFERFLNEERAQMPDIDLDIPDDKRSEILNYVHSKYGDNYVAQIVTFGTLSAKQVIRDVGRVFGLNNLQMSKWSNAIPTQLNIKLLDAVKQSHKLKSLIDENKLNQLIFATALKLEGIPRHYSTHAAGVIISANELINNSPVQLGNEGLLMTQYSKNYVEQVGLLKMDFLGLRNLSLIANIVDDIYQNTGSLLKISQIDLNDESTLRYFQNGYTNGVFQFESSGIKNVLRSLKPTNFELVAAVDALYRPGPMQNIDNFIKRKNDNHQINYADERLKNVLQPTFGIIVYQEQVMQLASIMAGFTLGEADILRRAMSKKKQEVMDNMRDKFIAGAISNGFPKSVAERTFAYIDQFASYGFNKSHAYAYSKMAFQLAYLKVHYPLEFYKNIFNSVLNNADKTKTYFNEVKLRNIKLFGPNINLSESIFSIKHNAIIFGLRAIKGLRTDFIRFILDERKNGKFTNLENFIRRIDSKFRKAELLNLLVYSGALDIFGYNRAELLNSIPEFISSINLSGNSMDLFNDLKPKIQHFKDIPLKEKLGKERECLGIYLSGHPVEQYLYLQKQFKLTFSDEFNLNADYVNTLFFISSIKNIRTKKGQEMAFLNGSDMSNEYTIVVFPEAYSTFKNYLKTGQVILVSGKVEASKKNNQIQLIAQNINLAVNLPKASSNKRLYLKIDKDKDNTDVWKKIHTVIKNNPGNTSIIIHREIDDSNKLLRKPYSINGTNSVINSLKLILGKDNAVYK